ncbi:MAG: dihydrofolate reductase [Verrucomicrobiota bacterium]
MIVSLIAAMDRHGMIGRRVGGLPWDLPKEKEHFRSYTDRKWMLVGRRTYEEMIGWFGERTPVVLTSQANYDLAENVVGTVEEAIEKARLAGAAELVVAGGAATYEMALPLIDRLVLTFVEINSEGDVAFPDWDESAWEEKSREKVVKSDVNGAAFEIVVWERLPSTQ